MMTAVAVTSTEKLEKAELKEPAHVEEAKQRYPRYRLREHYTCVDRQVSLEKFDIVDALDTQQETMWLVRHITDTHKVQA